MLELCACFIIKHTLRIECLVDLLIHAVGRRRRGAHVDANIAVAIAAGVTYVTMLKKNRNFGPADANLI